MHRLALGLGKSIAELEVTLGASELDQWILYWNEEPWGTWRDNAHAGLVAAACIAPHLKKGAPAVTFENFMLKSKARERDDETQRSLAWLTAMGVKNGG